MGVHCRYMKKILSFLPLIFILLMIGASAWVYPALPDQLTSHWNAAGEADGSMGKFWVLAMTPLIALAIYALFLVLPKLDPLHPNDPSLRRQYTLFAAALVGFFTLIHGLVIAWNFDVKINVLRVIAPATGALFIIIGMILPKTKRNWFMGIRTPWTLSSDIVWDKTQQLGGKLFIASGLIACIGVVFPAIAIWLLLVPILIATVTVVWYSWWAHHQHSSK
jgi:uncharacterized membrane protein